MHSVVKYFVSNSELQLVEEIQMIGYGEIYGISFRAGEPYGTIDVDSSFVIFLKMLKSGTRFDTVIISDSAPAFGKIEGKTNSGHKYIQKVKF